MDDSAVYKDATTRIYELMQATFADRLKMYYLGMPNDLIPEANFPCLIVHKVAGNISLGATGEDRSRSQIAVIIYLNQADDLNQSGNVAVSMRKLQKLVEGRDPTTGAWLAGTALNALRTQITLTNTSIELDADVNYEVLERDEGLTAISKATIEIITTERVSVPERR